ncbi:hypothetical protein AB2S62_11515 [Vibrio sp. NTOU-M3]|uniref:hypothetical protein n=1 Tax=Vibrio sp. NTOU-M3 TaxID=3234954 RepID=UPI00349F6C18
MLRKILPLTIIAAASNGAIASEHHKIYTQDFNGYKSNWQLITPVPFDYNKQHLSISEKLAYTPNNHILFDVRWSASTFRNMLNSHWNSSLTSRDVLKAFGSSHSTCTAKLEVGAASIYGPYPHNQKVAELDSDLADCGNRIKIKQNWYPIDKRGNPSSIQIRTFIPTTPGIRYDFSLDYAKRVNGYDKSQKDLYVSINTATIEGAKVNNASLSSQNIDLQTIKLPLNTSHHYSGFNNAKMTFVANNFFTPIIIRANDNPNSYGPILNALKVKASKKQDVTDVHVELCENLYEPYSPQLQRCLTEVEDGGDVFSCNVDEALETIVYGENATPSVGTQIPYVRVTDEGIRTEFDFSRYHPKGMTGPENSNTFYSVGRSGVTTVLMNCPIKGKSLYVREFTGGPQNRTFADYPEQGETKVRMMCLRNEEVEIKWHAIADIGEVDELISNYENNEQLLRTNRTLNVKFGDEYQGCRLTAIRFADKTHKVTMQDDHKLSESQLQSHLLRSDGFEIQALSIH